MVNDAVSKDQLQTDRIRFRTSDATLNTCAGWGSNNELEEYVLLRNDPNPFSDYTDINYETAGCEACQIVIVDLQGRVVKRINVKENAGVVRVYSSEIGQGLFSYSIIRNGVVIATSKMVSSR